MTSRPLTRIVIAALALSLAACSSLPSSLRGEGPVEHTVRYRGETLSAIALWYTGHAENWERLKEANPDLDPRNLTRGQLVTIPADLVVRAEPMPRSFVHSTRAMPGDATPPGAERAEDTPPPAAEGSTDGAETAATDDPPPAAEPSGPAESEPGPAGEPAAQPARNEAASEREQLLDTMLGE